MPMSSCELRGQFEGREVAERLRPSRRGRESVLSFVASVVAGKDHATALDVFYLPARLAKIIDPTTTVDETGVETVADAVHLCECNECGHSFEWVYGEYEYCPRCGSRIVGGNEHEKASDSMPLEGGDAGE